MSSPAMTAEASMRGTRSGRGPTLASRIARAHPWRWLRVLRNTMMVMIALAGVLCLLLSYQAHLEITAAGNGEQAISEVIAANAAIGRATSALKATAASRAAVVALPLNGAGNQYVNSYTSASKQLTLVALHNVAGSQGATDIPFAEGLLITYDDQVRQAIIDYAEGNDTLGKTEIGYVNNLGIQGALTKLLQDEQRATAADLDSWWLRTSFIWGLLLAPCVVLLLAAVGTSLQFWRGYRRLFSVRLLAAAAAALALVVSVALLNIHDAGRAKEFMAPWLRVGIGPNHLKTADLGASAAYSPLALGIGLALLVIGIVTAYSAYHPRLDEYRHRP